MILANSNPFVGDVAGIDRRLSLLTFEVKLPNQDTSVEEKLHAEVPWLMRIALSMSDSQVKGLIKGTGGSAIPDFEKQKWLHKTDNDSIALFMEEMVFPPYQAFIQFLGVREMTQIPYMVLTSDSAITTIQNRFSLVITLEVTL